ncbi:MAG: acetyl-CoA carboxylase biotin carboxyl carrier protein subunit [bacterium]
MAIKEFTINEKIVAVEILEQHPAYFKFKINDKTFEVSIEKHNPAKQILNFVINNHPVKIKYSTQQDIGNQFNDENLLIYIINHCAQILVEPVTQKTNANPASSNFCHHACPPNLQEGRMELDAKSNLGSPQTFDPKQTQTSENEPSLKSPLAGRIIKILVKPGDQVSKNQLLVIIESMKMENEICATFPGFIKNISITEGNLVQQNQVLITFG